MLNQKILKNQFFAIISMFSVSFFLMGCRGQKSSEPPILPVQNMVNQTSYGPQSENLFYKDKLAYRAPLEGVVEQGNLKIDTRLHEGKEPDSNAQSPNWVKKYPIKLDMDILMRGKNNYDIYCSPCHGYSGRSDGLVTQRTGGSIRPSNLLDKDRRALPLGRIYEAVKNGVNNWNMPGFASQLNVEDRWAVVAYVEVLQKRENRKLDDVPAEIRAQKGWSKAQ